MVIMRGDAFALQLELWQDGQLLTPEIVKDIEVCIGSDRLRFTLGEGDVRWEADTRCYTIRLTQQDTFRMCPENMVVARVKYRNTEDFDVRGVALGRITLADTYSSEVL